MPIIKHLLLIFALFIVSTCFSQAGLQQQNPTFDYKRLVVFFNPFNVLEPEIPIAVTFQQRFNKSYAVALDLGMYIASNDGFLQDRPLPASGFRFKPEFKIYFSDRYRHIQKSDTYFSFQAFIKHTSVGETERVGRQCNNGQCAFIQTIDYKRVKNVYGGNIIFGKENFLGKYQRFYIGMYIGFGLRYKHFFDKGLPDDVTPNNYDVNSGFGLNVIRNGWYPSVPMGINIGWRVK